MPAPLTDADIDKLAPLTDSDIDSHEEKAKKTFTDQLGDFGSHTWDMLKGTVTGPLHLVAHPIDTTAAILHDAADEITKGKEQFQKGDYDRALEHFKYALPVAGPVLRQMREETDKGDYGAALGDVTGAVLGGKALKLVPKVIRGAAELPAKVAEVAQSPGGMTMAKGAAQGASGAAAVASGHPFVGGGLLVRGWENIVKGVEERRAAQNAPPPLYDDLAQSLGGKKYAELSPDAQAQIRQAASQVREKAPVTPPAPTTGPIELGEPSKPSKPIHQQIDEDILERKAQAATPGPVSAQPAPAESSVVRSEPSAEAFTGGLAMPGSGLLPILPETVSRETSTQTATDLADAMKRVTQRHSESANPFLKEDEQTPFERGGRAAKVPHFAQVLHDAGVAASDMAKADDLQWQMATDKTNQVFSDVNHGLPSTETRQQVIEQMKALEKSGTKPKPVPAAAPTKGPLAANPKAVGLAQALAEEMRKSGTIGDLMQATR